MPSSGGDAAPTLVSEKKVVFGAGLRTTSSRNQFGLDEEWAETERSGAGHRGLRYRILAARGSYGGQASESLVG